MAANHWLEQPKTVADLHHDTNMRVEFEYENGKLAEVILKVLPLSTGIVYKIKSEALRNLSFELLTTT